MAVLAQTEEDQIKLGRLFTEKTTQFSRIIFSRLVGRMITEDGVQLFRSQL